MAATTYSEDASDRRDGVSWARLLWVGPLTVVVALAVNLIIRAIAQALNPALTEMGQLGRPMIILTLEGAILAVIVFALMVWLVPYPIRRYRIVGVIALLISLIPDLLLGLGGDATRTGRAMVLAIYPLRLALLAGAAGWWTSRGRWAIPRGCPARTALGSGADPDAAAHGHRGGVHRAADDADAGTG